MSEDFIAIAPCNIRKVKSRGVSIMEIEVPIEHHRLLTAYFDECVVQVNLRKGEVGQYGVFEKLDSAQPAPIEFSSEKTNGENIEKAEETSVFQGQGNTEEAEVKATEAKTRGPMCMQCVYMMNNPEFTPWLISRYPETVNRHNGSIDSAVKELLMIQSRKELDTNKHALERFKIFQASFMKRLVNA